MSRRKFQGFTLIELLVVIAIIAILAAILFPVFAQAREKARQASCMSNHKQVSLGILQYNQDFDEQFPLGAQLNGATWTGGNAPTLVTSPPDLRGVPTPIRMTHWINAVQPYMKNYQIANCPSATPWTIIANATNYAPPFFHYTMNGLLGQYSLAGVAAPASAILVWNGHLKTAYAGYSDVNPMLNCADGTAGCVYVPRGSGGCATGNGATDRLVVYGGNPSNYTEWVHTGGDNRSYVDGHVKYVRLSADPNSDPFASTNPQTGSVVSGGFFSTWWNGCHRWLFRPDYEP